MTSFLSLQPQALLFSPFINPNRASNLLFSNRSYLSFFNRKPSISVIRFSLKPPSSFTDLDGVNGFIHELFGKTEGLLYTLADAALSASNSVDDSAKQSGDWLSGITNLMETVLKVLKDGLSTLHVPYAYGFAIILLTVLVKAATFPLTKKQVESAMAMRSLQPQVKAIQQKHAGDQERIQLETARLYKIAGVNPLAGCLPTVATIPVWIGLYRALSNVANEGLLTEGFFWIPSLAGPTTVAAKQNGSGISWLFPFVDGHPPLGWSDTLAYLVLPLLLIISQYVSIQIMQASQANDPNMKTSQALTNFLPLMIGYFALSVPSGLSLYWFTNNILSTTQQIWLQKLGGAKNPVDNSIKAVQEKLQESITEANSSKVVVSRKEEQSASGGLRPGDRFRQIKEQEERKREQREEEKRKLAAKGTETINKEAKQELELVKTEAESTDIQDKKVQSVTATDDSSTGVSHVNGAHSTQASNKEQEKMPVPRMENGGFSGTGGVDGKEEIPSHGELEKEEATEMSTATTVDGVVYGENVQHIGMEQPSKRDDD